MLNAPVCNQRPIDRQTGFEIDDEFERFDQRNEIYCRSEWDPSPTLLRASWPASAAASGGTFPGSWR